MWETHKLSDVIEKGETINPTTNPDTKFSYIDVSSVDRKNFSISKTQTLRGKDAPSRARRLVKTGDVLFATVRPTLQRIAIVPEKLNGEVCSTGYIVLRPKASIICSKFIFYYMLSEKVNTQMESLQTGASYPAVNDTQVKKLHISFPSLSEQKIIVARLDAAYSEFENAYNLIEKSRQSYKSLKSAILAQELQSSQGEAA
jgi:Restriction endonuclease S subunits